MRRPCCPRCGDPLSETRRFPSVCPGCHAVIDGPFDCGGSPGPMPPRVRPLPDRIETCPRCDGDVRQAELCRLPAEGDNRLVCPSCFVEWHEVFFDTVFGEEGEDLLANPKTTPGSEGRWKRVCAFPKCGAFIAGDPNLPRATSHGYCVPCAEVVKQEIRERSKARKSGAS